MTALFYLWLGGAAPVTLLAAADWQMHKHGERVPAWAWAVSVLLWPVFAAHSAYELTRGKLG